MTKYLAVFELSGFNRTDIEEQLEELEQVHTGYTGNDDESYERYMEENRRFHCLIAQASGNRELADALGLLHDRLVRFMVLSHMGETLESRHLKLIKVLHSRDVLAARQAMLDEVNETREAILECVIEEEGAFWRLGARSAA